jgi:5-methylthioadenosine/S-adenosylhomocysteine deaminase
MATINGARALGLDEEIGSLEVGKSGDIVCVNLDTPASQPVHHPISLLVYSVCRAQVSDVWIAGRHLVADGQMPNEPFGGIMSRVEAWRRRLLENRD